MIDCAAATQYVVDKVGDAPIVASLANTKSYLDQVAHDRPTNFYMGNAMGLASSVGLGLALARKESPVILLDGDGSLLMNLGSLATETVSMPKNLIHVLWDNKAYLETGHQPTATAYRTDLAKVAEGAGFEKVERVETLDAFKKAFDKALAGPGPVFIHALVEAKRGKGNVNKSPTWYKHRFMDALAVHH